MQVDLILIHFNELDIKCIAWVYEGKRYGWRVAYFIAHLDIKCTNKGYRGKAEDWDGE